MLLEPKCSERDCRHFQGVRYLRPDEGELSEVNYCDAFPDGIPDEIAYGNNKHLKPLPSQLNEIVYEARG